MTEAAFCTREGEQTGHTHKRDSTYSLDKINHRLPKKTIEGKWNCHPGFWKLRIVPGVNEKIKTLFVFYLIVFLERLQTTHLGLFSLVCLRIYMAAALSVGSACRLQD